MKRIILIAFLLLASSALAQPREVIMYPPNLVTEIDVNITGTAKLEDNVMYVNSLYTIKSLSNKTEELIFTLRVQKYYYTQWSGSNEIKWKDNLIKNLIVEADSKSVIVERNEEYGDVVHKWKLNVEPNQTVVMKLKFDRTILPQTNKVWLSQYNFDHNLGFDYSEGSYDVYFEVWLPEDVKISSGGGSVKEKGDSKVVVYDMTTQYAPSIRLQWEVERFPLKSTVFLAIIFVLTISLSVWKYKKL